MRDQIEAYIQDHATAWSPSTLKSERSRLVSVCDQIGTGPLQMYSFLQLIGQKPYTIKTTFIRLCAFEKWLKQDLGYQNFMVKHVRRFRSIYIKEEIRVTYEEAERRIADLAEPYRSQAFGLLRTGLRLSESYAIRDGRVVGKGGKARKVYGTITETAPKSTFARKLKDIGLKPHTLRKLCATRLAERGATAADLCKIFGWSDIKTAYQYLQAKDDERISTLMEAR